MTTPHNRFDLSAALGQGFPMTLLMQVTPAITTTTGLARVMTIPALAANNQGVALRVVGISAQASTPGDRTTLDTLILQRVGANNNVLQTIGAFRIGNASAVVTADFRVNGAGVALRPGEGLRIDGAAGSGGASSAADIQVTVYCEAYGIVG